MSEPMHVDTSLLGVAAVRTRFKTSDESAALSPSFHEVADDMKGLQMQQALLDVQTKWEDSGRRLGGELENFASALLEAASAVENTDDGAAALIGRVRVA